MLRPNIKRFYADLCTGVFSIVESCHIQTVVVGMIKVIVSRLFQGVMIRHKVNEWPFNACVRQWGDEVPETSKAKRPRETEGWVDKHMEIYREHEASEVLIRVAGDR